MARVCMVAYTYYPTDTRVRREAEALLARGDSVDVICLARKGDEQSLGLCGVRLLQVPIGRYRGSSSVRYLMGYLGFFVAASAWLTIAHLRRRYQVIQVHTMPDFMVFTAAIPKLLGARVLLDVHDLMPELYQSKFGLCETHRLIRLIMWIERCSIAFAHRAIAVHEPHLRALVRHGNPEGKFTVLLNLPDPRIFGRAPSREQTDGSSFRLIYHGTLAERNGVSVVLRALPALREKIAGLKLEVAGEGDAVPAMVGLVKELGLTDCVEYLGFVPPEQLVPVITQADVGVVPLLYDGFTKYMLPVKLLEYVALGVPVVCSRTETIETYFDDTMVQYCIPGDAADFARCILALYLDADLRARLRKSADRFNQEYSWEQQKLLYYRLIDALVRAH